MAPNCDYQLGAISEVRNMNSDDNDYEHKSVYEQELESEIELLKICNLFISW